MDHISSWQILNDMCGNTVNDNFNYLVPTQSMHVGIFPFKNNETIAMAFYHRNDKKYRSLYHQLRSNSDDNCLQFLNYIILKHTENCYFSKKILDTLQQDSILRIIAREDNGLPDFGWAVNSWEELKYMRSHYQSPSPDQITNLLSVIVVFPKRRQKPTSAVSNSS